MIKSLGIAKKIIRLIPSSAPNVSGYTYIDLHVVLPLVKPACSSAAQRRQLLYV